MSWEYLKTAIASDTSGLKGHSRICYLLRQRLALHCHFDI